VSTIPQSDLTTHGRLISSIRTHFTQLNANEKVSSTLLKKYRALIGSK